MKNYKTYEELIGALVSYWEKNNGLSDRASEKFGVIAQKKFGVPFEKFYEDHENAIMARAKELKIL